MWDYFHWVHFVMIQLYQIQTNRRAVMLTFFSLELPSSSEVLFDEPVFSRTANFDRSCFQADYRNTPW